MLRELNLYPLWRLRAQPSPRFKPAPASALSPDELPQAAPAELLEPVRTTVLDGTPPFAHMGWEELQARVQSCTACPLRASCTQTVFGVGNRNADWLFVGEGPGAEEDLQGEPFVGQAGKLLDSMLMAIGLDRKHTVYIANVVKCRPPGNRTPQSDEIAQCLPYLRRQIELLRPRVIVALGATAASALLGRPATIGQLRGNVHEYHAAPDSLMGIPLIITYHPAYLLRTPPDKAKAWQDLRLAVATMKSREQLERSGLE